jgi:hypothetical protein
MSNLGWTEFDILNANQLYIKGQPFTSYISNLIAEDNLEQAEIDEIKAFLSRLDLQITVPNTLTITDDNRNSVLKTAIDLINTRLQYYDGTALSESWVVNNDNRNSVLKSRIDGHDTDISTINGNTTTLQGKTRYLTSAQGSNNSPNTPSTFNVSIGDRILRELYLSTGANFISSVNNSNNQSQVGNYTDNNITFASQAGIIYSVSHLNRIQAIDTIEITGFGGMNIQSSPRIVLGNKGAQILIGSEDTPEIGSTNTVIKIGKRTLSKNTETEIRGNVFLSDARFEDLTKSQALTWTNFLALVSTNNL